MRDRDGGGRTEGLSTTTCKRHPGAETRLSCSNCGDPICPRCAVPSAVGQKCPPCGRPARAARVRGKPRQYVKGVAFGLAAAGALAIPLWFVFQFGFLSWIASGLVGYAVGRAVRAGAEGNAATPFLAMAIVLALLSVAGAWASHRLLIPQGPGAVGTYLAAGFGAWLVYR